MTICASIAGSNARLIFSTSKVILNQRLLTRLYSEFFKKFPKVENNSGRHHGKNIGEASFYNIPRSLHSGKPNRFAQQYSRAKRDSEERREHHKESNIKMQGSAKASQYQDAKKALKDKERSKVPTEKKEQNNKLSGIPKKPSVSAPVQKIKIQIPTYITVANFATILGVTLDDLLVKARDLGFENISHNYILDKEHASLIAEEYDIEIVMNDDTGADIFPSPVCDDKSKLKVRPPIVTIMGHVDHGKTTILDYLRKSKITSREHGGITQHIGAFSVVTPISEKRITFLDTPGHAAFLKMRERGATVTDIVILVVAADDSVMPQTLEALKHAKKANVPIIVAINKCDKPGVNPDKVIGDLANHGIDPEEYGGDTQIIRISAKQGLNMDKLEESVIALSELNEFKSEHSGIPSESWIIESSLLKGIGNVATLIVKRGTIKSGTILVAGKTYCKVRGMKDESGKVITSAGPSTPVQIWGWKDLPEAGDQVLEAKDEKFAKKVVDNRYTREKNIKAARDIEKINQKRQEEISELEREQKINELKRAGFDDETLKKEFENEQSCTIVKYIIRADVFGSAQAIKESIDGLGNEEVKSLALSFGAGVPTDSDLETAKALDAKILCFHARTPKQQQVKADKKNVTILEYEVIYRLIEDVMNELNSKLKPVIETKILGEALIKNVFVITSKAKSKIRIAGCQVSSGDIKRSSKVKVIRNGKEIFRGALSSLKHVKNDIQDAKKGTECGMAFENWSSFQDGDVVQAYDQLEYPRYL